jgi:hypothetical protein
MFCFSTNMPSLRDLKQAFIALAKNNDVDSDVVFRSRQGPDIGRKNINVKTNPVGMICSMLMN